MLSPDGQPIKRVTVVLSSGTPGEQARSATTDSEGRFTFQSLASGRFTLTASKVGYVTTGLGARRPGGPSRPVEIADGATLDGANITLARGCVISGRLIDEYGDPVSGATVRVLKYRFTAGRRQLAPIGGWSQPTDDLGQFRNYGLAPDDYYVAAVLRPQFMNGDAAPASGYAPTYYPGTANMAEAARLSCRAGQDVANVDFALSVVPTVQVSGTLRDSSGKTPSSGYLMLMSADTGSGAGITSGVGSAASLQPDGKFTIGEVVPGEYLLRASVQGSSPAETEIAVVPLTVARNVTGMSITTGKMGLASGRVVPDTGLSFNIQPTQITVTPTPVDPAMPRGLGAGGIGRVTPDGTFDFSGLHGPWTFRAAAPGWALKALRLNGADVTDTPVTFRANADVSGLEVVLTNRLTSLSGTVTDAQGKTAHDYVLLLFAQDSAKWHWNSRYFAMGRPDQEGRFKLATVPPGSYFVAAVRDADPEEWTDPESLGALKPRATRITLAEGDAKVLELSLVAEEKR